MSYDTEKNRQKVAKYRTRKGLRDAGYEEEDISAIISSIDWDVTTPIEVLQEYVSYISPGAATREDLNEEGTGQANGWLLLGAVGAIVGTFIMLPVWIAHRYRN